jgi:aerobic-type carbon monoxide dehydrogenase small subunit (CoxS/CutS family)
MAADMIKARAFSLSVQTRHPRGDRMNQSVTLTVNGVKHVLTVDAERLLLDILREDLQLTGTKYGCGEGLCGACTVLIDGKNVRSCREKAVNHHGKSITTIEGLARGEALHPVQEAFIAEGAMQCGYCVPGMILATVALLEKNPRPTEEQVLSAMNGNICRCNNYLKILRAVHHAAGKVAGTLRVPSAPYSFTEARQS